MTWIRKDDQMPIHRKVAPLTDAAYRLEDEAMCWSSRNLTDGRIGRDELADVSKRGREKLAAELVARGLWHVAGYVCPSPKCPPSGPDGWVIHDYLEYNPSKEKVSRERDAKAERQRRWIEAKKGGKKDAAKDAPTDPPVDASQDALLTHAQRDANPAPPRPAPKEGGGGAPAATAARRAAAGAGGGGRTKPQTRPTRPPYAPNGQPAQPPTDLLAETKAQLKATAARQRTVGDRRERGALDRLRQVTPDVPIPLEPEPATPPEEAHDAPSAA